MEAKDTSFDWNMECGILSCKITSIQFNHQERNDFLWLRNSSQPDTFVGQQEDGILAVLKIQKNGFVTRFVLDPNLTCAFWDNEEMDEDCHHLYAQHKNGSVIVYTVDEKGVTEIVHIPVSKLAKAVGFAQHGLSMDTPLSLLDYDQGLLVLKVGSIYIACVAVSCFGDLQLKCLLSVPPSHISPETPLTPTNNSPTLCVHYVINGIIGILDVDVKMIYLYATLTGVCLCKINLDSLNLEHTLLSWRLSYDHSTIILLTSGFCAIRLRLCHFCGEVPFYVHWLNLEEKELAHKREHLKNRLCHFGDSTWRKEAVSYHVTTSQSSSKKMKGSQRHIGFKNGKARKKVERKDRQTSGLRTVQYRELGEIKDEGWTVTGMEASSSVVTILVQKDVPNRHDSVCFVNFSNGRNHFHRLPEESCMALSKTHCHHIVWANSHLMYISPHSSLQKDDIISGIMAFSGPGKADALCQTNQWTRTAIPITALGSSLQQRQLETLTFFFKSKQHLYSSWKQSQESLVLRNEIQEMEGVLQLVSDTVSHEMKDPQACIFARRLLSISLDFVYSLLEDAKHFLKSLTAESGQDGMMRHEIESTCLTLSHNISLLRKNMHLLENKSSQSKTSGLQNVIDALEEVETSSDASLEQYVKENRLSKLQSLLLKADGNTKTFRELITQMLETVKGYLKQKDISSCQQLLSNMGCKANETLWSLSQYYFERDLQEFVTGQLMSATALKPQQLKVVEFMQQLYRAYPNQSFNQAMKLKNDDKEAGSWTDNDKRLKNAIAASSVFLPSYCGELSPNRCDETGCQSELYGSVCLAWLNEWSEDMKKSALIDAEFLTSDDDLPSLKFDSQTMWRYFSSHNMLETLQDVVIKAATNISYIWPTDPVAEVQLGWSHLQKEILSLLLRLKKLNLVSCKSHDVDMQLFLRMAGGPLQCPHPLAYAGSSYLNQFHELFINHCIRSGLQLPLWMYCSIHSIDVRRIKVDQEPSWFRPFQLYYTIPYDPKDNAYVLLTSQTVAAELWSSTPSCPMTLDAMFNEGQIMAAMATLSYMKEDDVVLNSELVEKYLQQFPKMKSVLIPENPICVTKPNMTVYQLLMGSVPFNTRRLFGWHSTNSFAGEDSPRVMPHFSDASILGVQPSQQKLAFTYYLKQGRPTYAFLSLMMDELEKREESISDKRIHQACGAALWVAVQNFIEPRITSACVVFVEMLGKDSGLVRSMVHAGRILLTSKTKLLSTNDNEKIRECTKVFVQEIAQELQACVQSRRRFGPKLVTSLQTVVLEEIRREKLESTSFEASQKWTFINLLCHLLKLPLSTVYLQACAEADCWLMFIWFAQLHQYPAPQLQGLLQAFRSVHYRDHLHYILNNAETKLFSPSSVSSSVGSTFSLGSGNERKNSNQRAALYNKIGLKSDPVNSNSDDEDKIKITTPPIMSSFSSRLRHSEFHESEMPESMAPDDVFRMLFHSQAMPCQWRCLLAAAVSLRNPLFAELAACCGCPAIPSICGWLLASLDQSSKLDFLSHHGQMVSKWTIEKLELLIDVVMNKGQEDSLVTAFFILQNKSPLLPFFSFINECMERGHHASSKTYIDQFKDAIATFENQSSQESSLNGELPIIGDRAWVEKIVYQVVLHILNHMTCIYKAHRFLELLDIHNMSLVFRFEVLNFPLLHQVLKLLHDNEITCVNLVALLTSGTKSPVFEAECDKTVDFLIERNKFPQAVKLAKLTGTSKEKVVLGQLREEKLKLKKCGVWTAKYVRSQFWEKSCKMMDEAKVSFQTFEDFFQAELEATDFEYEKALLCQHWFSLLCDSNNPNIKDKRENIFRNMWRHRIAAKMSFEEQEPLDHIFDDVKLGEKHKNLKSGLVLMEIDSLMVSDVQEDLSHEEVEVLDSLMGSYLEVGRVNACARVASLFGHYSQDLAIIETCIALACGKTSIDNIEPAMKRLVTKQCPKRRLSSISKARSFSTCSIESVDSCASEDNIMPSKQVEVIAFMEKLCVHCNKGRLVCRRIITCFKIAEILDVPYQEIVQAQEFDILHKLLGASHVQKFDLAKEFLSTSGLLDEEVTKFLASLILETLKAIVSRHSDSEADPDIVLNSVKPLLKCSDGMEVFAQFIKLSENASLLGDHILKAVASLLFEDGGGLSPTVLTIQTEMIILGHECYTNASNMEGISHVLRAARVCCDSLAQAEEFSLMIRLLTGVGRYSEMLYIFHALQQHHQFELLLRKGMDREDKLKVAILEYLKRYQPEDNDAYTMVALKFSMYRDIAGLLEMCGNRTLQSLKVKTLDNNKETHDSLRKCLQYFQEAAESYVKDMSVRKAQRCIKLARLLTLQQQLLSNGTYVINLTRDEVTTFVSNHARFIEAMVVSDAYEQKVNWRDAIFTNLLVGGDLRYLQEMKLHVNITPTLVEDVLQKYKTSNVKPSGSMPAIRKLLSHCKDAQLQYKLASELGLTDVVSSMLKSDTGNYLQDVTTV